MKIITQFIKSLFAKMCPHVNYKIIFHDWQERCAKCECLDCNEIFYTDL